MIFLKNCWIGNIGNAKLQGMKADVLDNNDTEFSVVLCA